jgi:hypothetical protein
MRNVLDISCRENQNILLHYYNCAIGVIVHVHVFSTTCLVCLHFTRYCMYLESR